MQYRNNTKHIPRLIVTGLLAITYLSSTTIPAVAQGNFSARKSEPVKSVDYTCISCDIDAFVDHCDKSGGGLSTNPDGTTTCSIQPTKKSAKRFSEGTLALGRKKEPNARSFTSKSRDETNGTVYRCESDNDFCATVFVRVCEEGGGGASSDPDGGIICTTD